MTVTVAISINASWNVVNFRMGLIRALQAAGCRVVVLTPDDRFAAQFADLGIEHLALPMDRRGTSVIADLRLLWRYRRMLRELNPRVFLAYTIKPNIWGSLAAQSLRIPVVNNIAGLGETFRGNGAVNRLVRGLYRIALKHSAVVFFQNPDDCALFERAGIAQAHQIRLLPGSGIDLARFEPPMRESKKGKPFTFLLVARLLWAKGIADFVDAGRLLASITPRPRLQILGIEQSGRGAIDRSTLEEWDRSGAVEFLGATDDVRPYLAAADCVVLPTYYPEGTPRSLLEAAAMGRPIIATDVPGCREIVVDGVNGYLVPPRNAEALAARMQAMVELPLKKRVAMGRASRTKAEAEFDEQIVIDRYLTALADVGVL